MATMKSTLDDIFSSLRQLGRLVASRRRQGLSASEILSTFDPIKLSCPPDLKQLYEFCDGTDSEVGEALDQIQLFPGFYWMRLSEAADVYRSLIEDGRWKSVWFPIFGNGGGDFYAVVCDAESNDFGSVVGFLAGEVDHLVEFENVSSMFETIRRSYNEKAFFVANGYLEADYGRMRAIARLVQPNFLEHDA